MDANWLIDVLENNELVTRAQIDSLRFSWTDESIAKAGLQKLVDDKVLTPWQQQRLANGKENFRIADFRLYDYLGRDDFGEVFLATNSASDRFRLRLVDKSVSDSSDDYNRYLQRLDAFRDYPDWPLSKIQELIFVDDRILVVTSIPNGSSIDDLVKENRLEPVSVEKVLSTLVNSVAEMEKAGVLHGSIIFESVFVTSNGSVVLDLPRDIGWCNCQADTNEHDSVLLGRFAGKLLAIKPSASIPVNDPPITRSREHVPMSFDGQGFPVFDFDSLPLQATKLSQPQVDSTIPPLPDSAFLPPVVLPPQIEVGIQAVSKSQGDENLDNNLSAANSRRSKIVVAACCLVGISVLLFVLIFKQLLDSNDSDAIAKTERSEENALESDQGNDRDEKRRAAKSGKQKSNNAIPLASGEVTKKELSNQTEPKKKNTNREKADVKKPKTNFQPIIDSQDFGSEKKAVTKTDGAPNNNSPDPKAAVAEKSPKKEQPILLLGDGATKEDTAKGETGDEKSQPANGQMPDQNPFGEPPVYVELPTPESIKSQQLLDVPVPKTFPVTMRLHGGYFASPGKFEFAIRKNNSEENKWQVLGGPRGELQRVAEFTLKEKKLNFAWLPNANKLFYAKHLKNCGLSLSAANKEVYVALRKPVDLPELDFTKALNATTQARLIDLPNYEQISIQIVSLPEKLNFLTYEAKKKEMSGRADKLLLKHEFPKMDLFRLDLSCRYEQQQFKIRGVSSIVVSNIRILKLTSIKTLTDQAQKTISDSDNIVAKFKLAQENGNKLQNDELKKQFFESEQFKALQAQAQIAPDLKERALKYVDVAKKLDQSKIGFRIFYKAGEMEIDLARFEAQ